MVMFGSETGAQNTMKTRDLMAPDTDPTDEELEAVTRDMLDVIRERKFESDRRLADALEQASSTAENAPKRRNETDAK